MPATIWPPAPFTLPDLYDLGQMLRGDSKTFPMTLWEPDGVTPIDLTGADIWFTCKTDLALDDLEGDGFQLSTLSSGIEPEAPETEGRITVTIPASATVNLDEDTLFFWDVQVKVGLAVTSPIRGTLLVVRDVTRTVS